MPWRPLPRIAFAVATYPFQPAAPADLPLELGDELYIIEEGGRDGVWLRGYLVAPPSLLAGLTSVRGQPLEARVFSGVFPAACVEVREMLGATGAEGLLAANEAGAGEQAKDGRDVNGGDAPARRRSARKSWARASPRDSDVTRPESAPAHGAPGVPVVNGMGSGMRLLPGAATQRRSLGSSFPQAPSNGGSRRPADAPRPPAPVPMLKIGDETATSTSEPLIDEIASCLREWHSTNLHELLLSRRYTVLERLSRLVTQLDLSRRQLLHGVLTDQETTALREQTVWDLVGGNKMLANEIIVRDPGQRGRLLTGNDGPVEVSKLQATMSLLDQPPESAPDRVDLHHLMVELKGAFHNAKETPALNVYLGIKKAGEPLKPLTETFSIDLPSSRDVPAKAPTGQTARQRTLFTDLTSMDTGETTSSDAQLYLVVRAVMNRPIQQPIQAPAKNTLAKDADASRKGSGSEASGSTGKGGRRSFMWSSSMRSGSQRHRQRLPSVADESTVSKESLDEEQSPSESGKSEASAKPEAIPVAKQDIGIGVLPLKNLMKQDSDAEHSLTLWIPADSHEFREGEGGWDGLIPTLFSSSSKHYSKSKVLDNVTVRLHSFLDPDADNLIRMTPTLLHNISKTAKIGFSGAPTKPRSDIYITLQQPVLPGQALFSHPEKGSVPLGTSLEMQNLQLTLEVRRSSGDRVEHCIFPSSNCVGATAWRTTAAPNGRLWGQTIRLAIPTDDVPDCHLIMSLADAPGFPFALCWMPLWRAPGAFVPDGPHAPLLHLYDKTTSSAPGGRGAYLDLPWDSKAGHAGAGAPSRESWAHMAHLRLETYLCSTAFSQDQALLGLLRWREQADSELLVLLRQLVFVPEIELVKRVSDVFDALFAILVDRSGNDEYEDLVFGALVTVLGIVHDRRFHLGPRVDEYADARFHYPFATPCLIRSFLRLITRPADYQNARQLRATFKVGRQIMKFVVVARTQQKAKEEGIGITNTGPVFTKDFKKIFEALQDQMRDESPALVGSKTLIVQHMHSWLPELMPCFTPDEIMDIAIDFLNACAHVSGKLVLHKLILIYNLGKAVKSLSEKLQDRYNEQVEGWIAPCWGATSAPNEQYREQVRLCCSILTLRDGNYGTQLARYYIKILQSYHALRTAERPQSQSLSFLFPTSYPFPSRPLSIPRTHDENLIELAALKATISSDQLVASVSELGDVSELLTLELEVDMSILEGEAFPSSWLTLHVYHHRVLLSMFDGAARLMAQDLLPSPEEADSFSTTLWKNLQVAVLRLVRSEALALETLPEQKRRAVWKIAGDIREQGAELLGRIWDALGWDTDPEEKRQYGLNRLGGYQVQYVPSLVGPIIELCLSVHEGLRGVAVEILQSMIISEWTLNEDLAVVQAEMIYSLDDLFRTKNLGENAQQRPFVGQLIELFEPLAESAEKELWEATSSLIATIDRMLDLLVAVHTPGGSESETLRIMNTLNLMDFLKNMQKEDIYISYVHQLADVEAESRNYREAGLALGLHADLYTWDSTLKVEELKNPSFPKQTSFERKESLYFAMITHFEEGGAWEPALACYRELAEQYEQHAYDFAKLARTQRAMAKIFELIARGEGPASRYFRVLFHGLGFPAPLRGRHFIYEGSGADRLASFMDRLQQQHPAAQFVTQPGSHDDDEGQYVQVTAVSPHRDLEHPLYQRHKVPLMTKEYLFGVSPGRFSVTTRRHSPKTCVRDQWVEKTVYTTAEPFPTILRRSEIVEEEIVSLSPLQTAVERTVRKTSELVILEKRVKAGDTSSIHSMLEAIKVSVDPYSTTSVAQYRDILPRFPDNLPENRSSNESAETQPPQLQPLEVALQTALLDFTSSLRQCLNLLAHKIPHVEHEGLNAVFQTTFAPELAVVAPHATAAAAAAAPDAAVATHDSEPPLSPTTPRAPVHQTNGDHPAAADDPRHASVAAPPDAKRASSRHRIASMLRRHPSISQPVGASTPSTTVVAPPTANGALESDGLPAASTAVDGEVSRTSTSTSVGPEAPAGARPVVGAGHAATDAERKGLDARPVTATSGQSAATGGAVGVPKKPGSIRKRLSSTLGMGKKPSRRALAGNTPGTLEEE